LRKSRSNLLFNSFIILVFIVFLIHQILQKGLEVNIPFLDNYLDPFCLGVIAAFLFGLQHRWLFPERKISTLELLVLIAMLSLISEVLFPYLSDQFVADWRDVVAIALGSLVNHLIGFRKLGTGQVKES